MSLTREQVETLLRPINPRRVLTAQGQSHVAAFDVIAHLNRVFGFGNWDKEVLSLDIAHEHMDPNAPGGKNRDGTPKPKRPGWWVTYRCLLRLTIRDPHGNRVCVLEDVATGSAQNMPSVGDAHDFAAKNAVSYALKRCAKDLGDQFGLALYNKGMTSALVGKTLVMPEGEPEAQVDVEEHAPAPQTLGNDERQEPEESSVHGSPGMGDGPTAGDGPSPTDPYIQRVNADAELGPTPPGAIRPADMVNLIRALDQQTRADIKEYARSKGYKVTPASLTQVQADDLAAWLDRRP